MNNQNKKETAIQNEQQLSNNVNSLWDILSNIEKHLSSIAYSLDYYVFNDKRAIDKSHTIPD